MANLSSTATSNPNGLRAAGAPIPIQRILQFGVYSGLALILVSAMGIVASFADRMVIAPVLNMGFLLMLAAWFATGYFASKPPPVLEGMEAPEIGYRNLIAGMIASAVAGVLIIAFVFLISSVNLRESFINISPELLEILTFGQELGAATAILLGLSIAMGALGSGLQFLPERWYRTITLTIAWTLVVAILQDLINPLLRNLNMAPVSRFLFGPTGGLSFAGTAIFLAIFFTGSYFPKNRGNGFRARYDKMAPAEQRRYRYFAAAGIIVILAILPLLFGQFISEIFNLIGIFMLMGLGLNIVVGFAGLLDLGYVAFFAVGAYTTAILTSPSSPAFAPEVSFWLSIPFAMVAAGFAGMLVGTPVLRMRGDYLAIVTLGFGEIARILFLSDWLKPTFGGATGILKIPNIPFANLSLHSPPELYYPILAFCLLAIYISLRLKDSRIGRAWVAMREDEDVAEVMGINIVTAKLMAFVTGAVLASFSGSIFASKIGSVFPHSFDLVVSLTVLVLIIIGGLGSIPGVIVGAVVLVGLPQLLREFDEFREFFYGIALILIMRLRPEGLVPSVRWSRELHEEEVSQDAWLKAEEESASEKKEA